MYANENSPAEREARIARELLRELDVEHVRTCDLDAETRALLDARYPAFLFKHLSPGDTD